MKKLILVRNILSYTKPFEQNAFSTLRNVSYLPQKTTAIEHSGVQEYCKSISYRCVSPNHRRLDPDLTAYNEPARVDFGFQLVDLFNQSMQANLILKGHVWLS